MAEDEMRFKFCYPETPELEYWYMANGQKNVVKVYPTDIWEYFYDASGHKTLRKARRSDYFASYLGQFDSKGRGVIHIFGKNHTSKSLIRTINHESIHWVIWKIESEKTSGLLDVICRGRAAWF